MPTWLAIITVVVAVVVPVIAIRNYLRDDRDRVAAYLERIATMLAVMADELEAKGASPARCKELIEAIGNLDAVMSRSPAVYRARNYNELLHTLTTTLDAPARLDNISKAGAVVAQAQRVLVGRDPRPQDIRTIREASGLFKGAAEYIKAR